MKFIKRTFLLIVIILFIAYIFYNLFSQSDKAILSKKQAESLAKSKFERLIQEDDDQMVQPWKSASLGDSVLVRTINGEPSYWKVLVVMGEKVIGFIDVKNENIPRYGFFYQNPEHLENCPAQYPVITAEDAKEMAKPVLLNYANFSIGEPVYVHDGAVETRLAWMIEIKKDKVVISRVFVTPKFVYERKGETIIDTTEGNEENSGA